MSLEVEDLLFSESGFSLPSIGEDEYRPSYNPSVELTYDPHFDRKGIGGLVSGHENLHYQLSKLPSICFEQTLSFLLYQEFAKDKFKDSSKLSALFPSKNPSIRMLKSIFDEVHLHNAAAQEAFTLQSDYQAREVKMKRARIDPDEWLRQAISKHSKEFASLDGLETIYDLFCRSDFMWKASGIMRGFAFAPPIPSIDFPSTADDKLDHSKIDAAKAQKIIDQFRERYLKFPYSPWKRLAKLVKIAREVKKSRNPSLDNYLDRICDDWGFITLAFRVVKAPPRRLSLYLTSQDESGLFGMDLACPYEKSLPNFCPIDMFNQQGLDVGIEGFGDPIALDDDHENEISHCRKIKCPRNIHIRNASHLDKQGLLTPFLKWLAKEPRTIFSTVDHGERPPVNWPRRSFLLASEALKDIVFNHPQLAEQSGRVVLTDYFQIVRGRSLSGEVIRGRSHTGRLTQFVEQLKKEDRFFKVKEKLGLLGAQDVSPFISLDEKKGRGLVEPAKTLEIRLD